MKFSTRTKNRQTSISAKWFFLALAGSVMSGCVSGPSAYLKNVSEETALARGEQLPQSSAQIEPVQSAALAPPTASPSAPSEEITSPTAQTQLAQAPAQANTAADNAPLALVPTTLAPLPSQGATTAQDASGNTLANAYSPSVQTQNIAGHANSSIDGLTPSNSFAIGLPSEPVVDPLEAAAEERIPILYASIEHGQCKSGRGPTPRKISATNINPGDPYYIEIRMRHTPLLPVGHTYVAYGRLGAGGQILDEKLIMLAPVGGYAGAALASGIPMPGILNPHPDDCRIRPKTAYRVSLNAQRYEKLLLEVQKARQERPSYLLFAYNCNHFMTRMAKSVGIKPPRNIYVPALEYIYAMIEENEGRKISRR